MSVFRIKTVENVMKYYVLGILLIKLTVNTAPVEMKLFGLFKLTKFQKRVINRLCERKVNFEFDDKNFMPFHINNDNLLTELRKLEKFTYIPDPGNLGDCLLAQATYDFFDRNQIKYRPFRKGAKPKTIVYGGGGIWVKDYYKHAYTKYLKLMKQADKVIILPSSVCECPDLVQILDERFVVFCREKRTYEYLIAQKTAAKIILDHDMALRLTTEALKKKLVVTPEQRAAVVNMHAVLEKVKDVAWFLRKDVEKSNAYESHYDLSHVFGSRRMHQKETAFGSALMLSVVDSYRTVVTDRLHVGIVAALMGKEVYLLDNSYKKISSVYHHSLAHLPHVHLCSSFPNKTELGRAGSDNFERLFKGL